MAKRNLTRRTLLAAIAAAPLASRARADTAWPDRPVRVIVPYPPAGGADTTARILYAKLGEDLGRFAFRPWTYELTAKPGKIAVTARATNAIGQSQTASLILNPAGYHHNVMQTVTLSAA